MKKCTLILMAAVLVTAGCARQNMNAVPDRGSHAYNADGPAQSLPPAQQSTGAHSAPLVSDPVKAGGLRPGEEVVIVASGERLYHIAERHGVELRWLIERNDIVRPVRQGQQIIVSRRTK